MFGSASHSSLRRRIALAVLGVNLIAVAGVGLAFLVLLVEPDMSRALMDRAGLAAVLATIAAVIVSSLLTARLLTRLVLEPLRRLAASARRVEAGDDAAFVAERDDEVGTLARSLERMRLRLAGYQAASDAAARRAETVARVMAAITAGSDEAMIATLGLEAIVSLADPAAVTLHLVAPDAGRAMRLVAAHGVPPDIARMAPPGAPARCPGVRRRAMCLLEPDPATGNDGNAACALVPGGGGTALCAPIVAGRELLGVLHGRWTTDDPTRADVLPDLERVVAHVGLALANQRLVARLSDQARTDPRTGLLNSREFERVLRVALARRRWRSTHAVLLCDLDRFKAFNDRHGHAAGDAALRAFAEVLRTTLRSDDIVARYGGEEFVALLPDTEVDAALEVAVRLRAAIEGMPIKVTEGLVDHITVSIGVAIAPADGSGAEDLIRAADQAMYRAKASGRNRVRRFEALTAVPVRPAPAEERPGPRREPEGVNAVESAAQWVARPVDLAGEPRPRRPDDDGRVLDGHEGSQSDGGGQG